MKYYYDVIVVGSGMGGLTTACYTAKEGHRVLLLEKQKQPGGLFGSFTSGEYVFDHGARAVENSGIMFPMFKQLGLNLDFVKSPVHIRTQDHMVPITSDIELDDYEAFLGKLFPEEKPAIKAICNDIISISKQMRVLYGIDNPLFVENAFTDMKYLSKVLLPWFFKFIFTIPRTQRFFTPVIQHLEKFTNNRQLIDFISQHFFEETPAIFAMSYFSLYTDYNYPKGGTGKVVEEMVRYFKDHHGTLQLDEEVLHVDSDQKTVLTKQGHTYAYKKLVWAGSTTRLHQLTTTTDAKTMTKQKTALALTSKGKGADSVMTMFMKVKDPGRKLAKQAGMHTFYTPYLDGLSGHPLSLIKPNNTFVTSKKKIMDWVKEWYRRNTFEISVPVLRDETLAPSDESGFIVSILLDYSLTKYIADQGWYTELIDLTKQSFVDILDETWLNGLKKATYEMLPASPLTMEKFASVHQGSLSGWSFANRPMLSEYYFTRVNKSVITPYQDIYQAGQWAFAPAGLPTCALTGKLASDRIVKELKTKKKK